MTVNLKGIIKGFGPFNIFHILPPGWNPPVWQTPDAGSIGEFYVGDAFYNIGFFYAIDPELTEVTYALKLGSLPNYLQILSNGTFIGGLSSLPGDFPPIWTGADNFGIINEGDTFSTTLVANGQMSKDIDKYSVVSGFLPWGITLNAVTGLLSGTELELVLQGDPDSVYPYASWVSPAAGSLGTINEGDIFGPVSLVANSGAGSQIQTYSIMEGILPWGLVLDSTTGVISGTELKLVLQPEPESVIPAATWVTSAGSLGTYNEGDQILYTLIANPGAGSQIQTYAIMSGILPWGITLNTTTGQLNGFEQAYVLQPVPEDVLPKPTWITGTNLGSHSSLSAYNVNLSVTPNLPATTISTYAILSGSLPWGITLNTLTGNLSGTFRTVTGNTVYTFTVRATDDQDGFADRTFMITVTP